MWKDTGQFAKGWAGWRTRLGLRLWSPTLGEAQLPGLE